MSEITVTRRGRVTYLAGYRQDAYTPGQTPVYLSARVEELSDGAVYYFPSNAAVHAWNTDGSCKLPTDLLDKVVWA